MGMTNKQRDFIDYYFLYDQDAVKAVIEAGYSPLNAQVTGCRLLKSKEIAKVVEKKRQKFAIRVENTVAERVKTAVDILELSLMNKKFQIALSANEQLIKLGGFYAPDKQQVTVVSHVERLKQLQALEEQGLLPKYSPIDAEYSESGDNRPQYNGSRGVVEGDVGDSIGVESGSLEPETENNG